MRRMPIAFCLMSIVALSGCSEDANGEWQAMYDEKMSCPDGAIAEIDRWGKANDMLVACKMKHGKFTGWKNGKKSLEGNYAFGKQVGTWNWFDEKGDITKSIEYIDGKEVSDFSVEK